MKSKVNHWKPDTEGAWQHFYLQAQKEGLLPKENEKFLPNRGGAWRIYLVRSVAAALCLLCIGVSAYLWLKPSSAVEMVALYNDHPSQVRVTGLHDGSVVYLFEDSKITYPLAFAPNQRNVSLRGEAFFEVSHDGQRPFFVETEQAIIEVLGTAFWVNASSNNRFEVAVKCGMVKVTLKEGKQEVLVEAGERMEWIDDLFQKGVVDVETPPSQQELRLYFKEEPLEQIVRVMNEYMTDKEIVLADDALRNKRITLSLDVEKINEAIKIICTAFNLKSELRGNIFYIGGA